MSLPGDEIRPVAWPGPDAFGITSQDSLTKPPGPSTFEQFIRSFDEHEEGPDPDNQLYYSLDQSLKGYHSQLIALRSAIGTGLFIASGEGLAVAGPIPLLAAYCFIGMTLCPTVFALGEMTTLFPLPGGFFEHCRLYTDEAWGGAMGWKYVLALLLN
jgi:amino acid transporter